MPSWLNAAQLLVRPGAGLVGRWPGVVIVVGSATPQQSSAVVDELIGSGGWPRPEVLRDRFEAYCGTTPVAGVIEQPADTSVWVYSSGISCFDAAGKSLDAGGALVAPGDCLSIGVAGAAQAAAHRTISLVEGLVPGAGAVLCSGGGDDAAALAAEVDRGVSAVFDDGSTYALDQNYVLGREPTSRDLPGFRPIVLDDAENSVSRAHAELVVQDRSVLLTDLGSTNGTHLLDPSTNQWSRLVPNVPTMLEIGSRVAVGSRQFVIERSQ